MLAKRFTGRTVSTHKKYQSNRQCLLNANARHYRGVIGEKPKCRRLEAVKPEPDVNILRNSTFTDLAEEKCSTVASLL
jgi:hypothetical protein